MAAASSGARTARGAATVLGRDAGPGGRIVRVLAGALALTHLITTKVPERSTGENLVAVTTAVGIAVAFTVALALLKPRLTKGISRGLSGWPGGALLLLPMLIYPIGVLPDGPALGVALYTELSVLIAGLIGYGGLELAALPTLALGFRPVLYGPFNAVDLAERGMRKSRYGRASQAGGVLAIIGLGYFWTVPPLAAVHGSVGDAVSGLGGLGPVAGALVIAAAALVAVPFKGPARIRRLRAGALLLLGLGGVVGALPDALWPVVILTGLVVGVLRLSRGARDRKPALRSIPVQPVPVQPPTDRPVADRPTVETSSTAR
ncbi:MULTISPECIES: DUF6410 domain-containing protein [unclassified Streptomyces]|uniref:DUF6410 domain-containing protein n=1 Tax=unclassified Streptomyces TaxID=2593676 RepID=UPI000DC76116|nr:MULTISPECIES: DUF6410 domain-containing protein [unclassified Streptomyces]AWZ04404.1 hypothetical protein DRB89_06875 [Streptomyces sp. ICC4]AWZ12080.1 hypothetical protein DRB96_06830 [Streptomyces sp. ICC1]